MRFGAPAPARRRGTSSRPPTGGIGPHRGTVLLEALKQKLDKIDATPAPKLEPDLPTPKSVSILRALDLSRKLEDRTADRRLLSTWARSPAIRGYLPKRSARCCWCRGTDARRKGRGDPSGDTRHRRAPLPGGADFGTDRRGTGAAVPVALLAPSADSRARGDLRSLLVRARAGRAHRGSLPRRGLAACLRRNQRLRTAALRSRTIVLKFWLWISPEEQLRRFKDRQATAYKQYKITEDDWRNRRSGTPTKPPPAT